MKVKLKGEGRNQKPGESEMHYGLAFKVMPDGSRVAMVSDDDTKLAKDGITDGYFSKVK